MLSDLFLRARALFRAKAVDREIDEELRFHIDRQIESYRKSGLNETEAARRARLEFGGLEQIKEEYRDALATVYARSPDLRPAGFAAWLVRPADALLRA